MNGLKQEWEDKVLVMQLNIHDPSNQALLRQLEANFTPTFILFDLDGEAVWRQVGGINPADVNEAIDNLVDINTRS